MAITVDRFRQPEALLRELGITEPEDLKIEAIAQYCGATVVYEPLEGCEAWIIGKNNRAIITVNNNSNRRRQRFSAGHELGHWAHDRGTIASYSCQEKAFKTEWQNDNLEQRANVYAAELLLPEFMFAPLAKNRPMIFDTVEELANRFEMSLTATAIRLVKLGSYPAILFGLEGTNCKQYARGEDVFLRIVRGLRKDTYAYDLLQDSTRRSASGDASADSWIDHPNADRVTVHEDALRIGSDLVLSLVWFKDERQFLELQQRKY